MSHSASPSSCAMCGMSLTPDMRMYSIITPGCPKRRLEPSAAAVAVSACVVLVRAAAIELVVVVSVALAVAVVLEAIVAESIGLAVEISIGWLEFSLVSERS